MRDDRVRGDVPAERNGKHPQQSRNDTSFLSSSDTNDGSVRESAGEEHEHPKVQKDKEASDGLVVGGSVTHEADGVVPSEVDENSHEGVPSGFDDDVGQDVCCEWLGNAMQWS
jgi:hypothetical protein